MTHSAEYRHKPDADYYDRLFDTLVDIANGCLAAHEDHPLRHWDRTCPACMWEEAAARVPATPPSAPEGRSEVMAALVELLEAESATYPPFEAGREAQDAWSNRRAAARDAARNLIANPAPAGQTDAAPSAALKAVEPDAAWTEEKVRVHLGDTISEDGGLFSGGWYVAWTPGDADATLDATFTAGDLEAIAWWMRHKSAPSPPNELNAAPSTAELRTAPSQEGVGQGGPSPVVAAWIGDLVKRVAHEMFEQRDAAVKVHLTEAELRLALFGIASAVYNRVATYEPAAPQVASLPDAAGETKEGR